MEASALPTRPLGPDGSPVGAIGLGCMGMSWAYNPEDRDDERSISVIRRALELGVTLIDTADVYGPFTNEELVGRALEGHRADAVLATKCGLEVLSVERMEIARNGRPEHVRDAIDGSLARLGTDHVDLYQLHRTDPDVPLEETWGAMAETVAAGKARAIGMSEATRDELEAAQAIHPVASLPSSPSRLSDAAFSPARSRGRRSAPATCAPPTRVSPRRRRYRLRPASAIARSRPPPGTHGFQLRRSSSAKKGSTTR